MLDLWPADIGKYRIPSYTNDTEHPITILNRQSSLLHAKTNYHVTGKVIFALPLEFSLGEFTYTFSVTAPQLNIYQHQLFEIAFDDNPYPLKIALREDIGLTFNGTIYETFVGRNIINVLNRESYEELLHLTFSCAYVRRIVGLLWKQSCDWLNNCEDKE